MTMIMTSRRVASRLLSSPALFFRTVMMVAVLCLGAALLFQVVGGLMPCRLCLIQRGLHAALLLLAMAGMAWPQKARVVMMALIAVFAAGAIVAGYHAGLEYGWWRDIVSCTSDGNSLDDIARQIAEPPVPCNRAPWMLMGISMAGYNALLSLGGVIASVAGMSRQKNRIVKKSRRR